MTILIPKENGNFPRSFGEQAEAERAEEKAPQLRHVAPTLPPSGRSPAHKARAAKRRRKVALSLRLRSPKLPALGAKPRRCSTC